MTVFNVLAISHYI